ncbi:type II secretion system F family protein [Francisellaceae bacterium]|nr:type II secretion system F family protein [Francisellaceae bacterium]
MATDKKTKQKVKINIYTWKAKDKKGNKISGETSAPNMAYVRAQLLKKNIQHASIKKKPKPLFGSGLKKVKPADVAMFARQMSTMMQAGVPMTQALTIMINGTDHTGMKALVNSIRAKIESGYSFSQSLREHPKNFDDLFVNLIHAGEESGSLEIMLDRIATYKEKIESIKKKIKKALTYPIAVLITAFAVSAILLIFVVPTFKDLFDSFGADLPGFTQMVLDMSDFMKAYWWAVLLVVIVLVVSFVQAKRKSLKFREFMDKVMLKFPIIGKIFNKSCLARFARTLATTFTAGMPLIEALKAVSGATGNLTYEYATLNIRDSIASGISLQEAMTTTGKFPNMVVQMVGIGEESGNLDDMLSKVAEVYEEEVDLAVDSLSSLLEPLIMVVLGVLVGGLVVAMYLPIFQMGSIM